MNKIKEKISDLWYYFIVNPLHNLKYNTKWFLQRRIYGFDDREIWNIDSTFYNWLLPRLNRFKDKTVCYPTNYKSMSSWQKELVNRVTQLELIVKHSCEEYTFPCPERYLSDEEIKKYKKDLSDEQIKYIGYNNCIKNFNKWFSNNINDLWY